MKSTTLRTLAGAAVPLLVVALSGCSVLNRDAEEPETSAEEGYVPGPLEEYFEQIWGEDSYDEEDANRQMMEVEEVTASCMAEAGFEYTPVDQTQGMGVDLGEELDVEWGTKEFAEQYGYGQTTDPWGSLEQPVEEQEWIDPNADYVEAMSETEREAYYAALYGNPEDQEYVEGEEPVEWDWTTAGCSGFAQHEVYGDGMMGGAGDEFAALEEEMGRMWESVDSDPRMVDVTQKWAACMADAGKPGYAAIYDAEEEFSLKVQAIYEEAWGDGSGMETEEDWQAAEEAVQEQLKDLQAEEIEIATIDYGCREEVGVEKTRREVDHALQQEFVDQHREELEAYVEAMKEQR